MQLVQSELEHVSSIGDSGHGGKRATQYSLLLLYFFTTAVRLAVADFRCIDDMRNEQDLNNNVTKVSNLDYTSHHSTSALRTALLHPSLSSNGQYSFVSCALTLLNPCLRLERKAPLATRAAMSLLFCRLPESRFRVPRVFVERGRPWRAAERLERRVHRGGGQQGGREAQAGVLDQAQLHQEEGRRLQLHHNRPSDHTGPRRNKAPT